MAVAATHGRWRTQRTRQRFAALDRANEVRLKRAQLKRDVRAGRAKVALVLTRSGSLLWLSGMPVRDLLMAQSRWGSRRADTALNACGIGLARTVGALTPRQRDALIARLMGWGSADA